MSETGNEYILCGEDGWYAGLATDFKNKLEFLKEIEYVFAGSKCAEPKELYMRLATKGEIEENDWLGDWWTECHKGHPEAKLFYSTELIFDDDGFEISL